MIKKKLLIVLISLLVFNSSSISNGDTSVRNLVEIILDENKLQSIFDEVFDNILNREFNSIGFNPEIPIKNISNQEKMNLILNNFLEKIVEESAASIDLFEIFYKNLNSSQKKEYLEFTQNDILKIDDDTNNIQYINSEQKQEKLLKNIKDQNTEWIKLSKDNINQYYFNAVKDLNFCKENPNFSVKDGFCILNPKFYSECPEFSKLYTYSQGKYCYLSKQVVVKEISPKISEDCQKYLGLDFEHDHCFIQHVFIEEKPIEIQNEKNCYKYRYNNQFSWKDSKCQYTNNTNNRTLNDCIKLNTQLEDYHIYYVNSSDCITFKDFFSISNINFQNPYHLTSTEDFELNFDFTSGILTYIKNFNKIGFSRKKLKTIQQVRLQIQQVEKSENQYIWGLYNNSQENNEYTYLKFIISESDFSSLFYNRIPNLEYVLYNIPGLGNIYLPFINDIRERAVG